MAAGGLILALGLVGCSYHRGTVQEKVVDLASHDDAAKPLVDTGAQLVVSDRPIQAPNTANTLTLSVYVPSDHPSQDVATWVGKKPELEAAAVGLDDDLQKALAAVNAPPMATQVEVLLRGASSSSLVAQELPAWLVVVTPTGMQLNPELGAEAYPEAAGAPTGTAVREASAAVSVMAAPAAAAPATPAALAAHGKDVFATNCAMCHQLTGQGVPGTFPPLAGSEVPNGPAAAHIQIVLNGKTGPLTVQGKSYNGTMPPWKQLSDEDLAAVITYERTSWGNHGGSVSPQQVKAAR